MITFMQSEQDYVIGLGVWLEEVEALLNYWSGHKNSTQSSHK